MKAPIKTRAFTLVEVLVVVVVVALIAALLIPAVSRGQEQARSAACLQNVRQLISAYHSYFADAGKLPQEPSGVHYNWNTYLVPNYLPGELRCPSVRPAERAYRYCFRYAFNTNLNAYYPYLTGLPVPTSRFVMVSEFYYFVEGFTAYTGMDRTMKGDAPNIQISSNAGFRGQNHFGGLNLGFLDGHAELVKPDKNTWAPTSDTYAKSTDSPTGLFYYTDQVWKMQAGRTNVGP